MDERLDYYSSEEMLRKVSSQWMIGHAGSSGSLERDSSRLFLQYKNYHLHLIEKKQDLSERPRIPATKMQRLAYYRQYVTSITKTQVMNMQMSSFNLFVWNYLFIVIFKCLPHTYVNIFLASYTPEEHLFVPKMVPFFHGFKFVSLATTFSELLNYVSYIIYLMGYVVHGLTYKNPWNRCKDDVFQHSPNVRCYEIDDFAKTIRNGSWTFKYKHYETSHGEKFQLVQVEMFRNFYSNIPILLRCTYFIIITLPAAMSNNLVTKKMFWKILNIVQWSLLLMEVAAYLYIICTVGEEHMPTVPTPVNELSQVLVIADIDMLSQSMTAPPVLHVLTARSTQAIKPNLDSVAIVMSNAFVYVFRGMLMIVLKDHCQGLVGTDVKLSNFNPFVSFYLWPLFFAKFYLGDLYTMVYFASYTISDVMTFIVTYHCFVEVVIYEYKWLKRWMVALITPVCCLIAYTFVHAQLRIITNIYIKGIVTFAEVLIIYGFYPVGRLVDDITFHTGNAPTRLRILLMRLVPVFYFLKLYILFSGILYVLMTLNIVGPYMYFIWCPALPLILLFFGMIYISYKYIVKDRTGWQHMFIPVSSWGPRDQTTRQLRKLYDSRFYIGSQAIRNLSRYMLQKSESKAFQLDLNYEPNRRSTMPTSMYRMESEKKED